MSLLADSSPPQKMLGKQLCESGGLNSCSFPSNLKRPKLDACRSFLVKSGCAHPETISALDGSAGGTTNISRAKVVPARDFPEKCGPFASGINGRKSEWSGNVENPIGAKYEAAIPAVPLRSIPSAVNVEWNHEKSTAPRGRDDDIGQKLANNTEKLDPHQQEESWEHDSEKLSAIIAEAKEFLNLLDDKYSASKLFPAVEDFFPKSSEESKAIYQPPSSESDDVFREHTSSVGEPKPKPKPLIETVKQEKRARQKVSAESVVLQNLDGNLSGKRMKLEDGISKLVQEEKAFGMGTKWEVNEEEVCVLSPAEWNVLQLSINHKGDGAEASKRKIEKKLKKWTSDNSSGKCQNMIESQVIETVDLVDSCSFHKKYDQQSEGIPDCELTESKCSEEQQEHCFMDSDELVKREQLESAEKFSVKDKAIVVSSGMSIKAVVNCHDGPKYFENHKGLVNLQIVQHNEPQGCKVMETLKLFEEQYVKLLQERETELREGKCIKYAHHKAAEHVKAMGMSITVEKPFGHIPGIEIGDEFRFRTELAVVGLHCQLVSGIDYVVLDGKKYATSVVDSGRYKNNAKTFDILIYCGQGGNPKLADRAADQKLEKGNLALLNSKEMGYPVRVTYKRKSLIKSKTLGMSNERNFIYVYDGLYTVKNYWQEREDQSGKLVFKFELHRLPGQPRSHETNSKSGKLKNVKEVCVLDDVSQGKEKSQVRAVNGVDDELPLPFTYITNIIYPCWCQRIERIGCDCINGCLDSQQCPCVLKNGGEIPFNENGAIIRVKPMVHECGPSCKCPPSCMNRVSQHGPRYQLEIFKTKSRGWGVRSRNYIACGSFICEYVGELLRDKEAEERVGNDEYLFDICTDGGGDDEGGQGRGEFESFADSSKLKKEDGDGFALDAATYGNIGRFINHSCSPNLYAQEILYDHNDKRMPHIMFFATEKIAPLRELTYDYNYSMRVCDVNGNIKMKDCYCGSRECTGRMY